MQLVLFCSQVQPAARLSVCPRVTHTEDTDTAGYTCCHEEALPSTAPTYSTARTHVSADSQVTSSPSAHLDWSSLVKAYPPTILFTWTFAYPLSSRSMGPLSTNPAQIPSLLTCSTGLLLANWSSLMCASKHTHTHTHLTGILCLWVVSNPSMDPMPVLYLRWVNFS